MRKMLRAPGVHLPRPENCMSFVWDVGKFASSVYFYRPVTGQYVQTRKLLLLK